MFELFKKHMRKIKCLAEKCSKIQTRKQSNYTSAKLLAGQSRRKRTSKKQDYNTYFKNIIGV